MTDQDHAKAIQDALTTLNSAQIAAVKAGLMIEVDYLETQRLGWSSSVKLFSAKLSRPVMA